jgi:multisubunit Na+/H+ antiporter MnhF subunit
MIGGGTQTILAAAKAGAKDTGNAPNATPVAESAIEPVLNGVLELGLVLLVIGMLICIYRLLKGPSLADRVTAADTLSFEVTGLVIALAIRFRTTIFFDTALVVAIVGFVSTVAFAQYIGAGASGGEEEEKR